MLCTHLNKNICLTPHTPTHQATQQSLSTLLLKTPEFLSETAQKECTSVLTWEQRLGEVEAASHKIKITIYSDHLSLATKLEVEKHIEQQIKEACPQYKEVVVFFERKIKPTTQPQAQQPTTTPQPGQQPEPRAIPNVKHVVLVGSGKGGVGKSTVSVNLALALKHLGYKTGILDADIYGPNIPTMMGLEGAPLVLNEHQKIITPERHGVQVMSVGFMASENTPILWRGPLIARAVLQFCEDIAWENLDFLIVDLPPGTGDIQISLAHNIVVTGAVVVTTPQTVATQDANRALLMFQKLNIPILGIIENMAGFVCPHCHQMTHIFGTNALEKLGAAKNTTLLASIPLEASVREGADQGLPAVLNENAPLAREAFIKAAQTLIEKITQLSRS